MQDIAFLEYTFIFDTNKTFQHLSQFEKVISDAFLAAGYQAEAVKAVGAAPNRRILFITELPKIEPPAEPVETKSVKQIKANLSKRRTQDGKFIT